MICCEHCFTDKEIISIIRSITSIDKGLCPTCGKQGHLYDTEKYNNLTPLFEGLLNIYSSHSMAPISIPQCEFQSLLEDIEKRWKVFGNIERRNKYNILTSICKEVYSTDSELFDGLVVIPELYDKSYLQEYALLKGHTWEEFVFEIKNRNRYHTKLLNFKILEKYCSYIRKIYKAGTIFYRARISNEDGFPTNEMSAPPLGKSSEGRANARGITCLYLANDIQTTFHEVRAGAFNYVTVGTFRLKEDITIVNLRSITEISPFIEDLDFLDHAINQEFLRNLNFEMSKPLRKSDSNLDYVPTQYITDYIKNIEHDGVQEYAGIEYESTMNADGYNLAIFDPELFECIEVKVYEIGGLTYNWKEIKK